MGKRVPDEYRKRGNGYNSGRYTLGGGNVQIH